MSKEPFQSDHEVYGPRKIRQTPMSEDEIAQLRREFAESGAQNAAKRQSSPEPAAEDEPSDSETIAWYESVAGSRSRAYAELGNYSQASEALIEAAQHGPEER